MEQKEAYIVTGATGGIGKAILTGLCRSPEKITVVLACRNVAKAGLLASELMGKYADKDIHVIKLDLESFASVRDFAGKITAGGYRIKGLIHNAGTMPGKLCVTDDGFESATQTNFLSPMLLTELITGQLMPGASVVFTTSMTRKIARFTPDWANKSVVRYNRFVTYGRSKKMLTAYALMLSERLRSAGIKVNCSDPWIVNTGIITMGNKVIDCLSSKLFRPMIYTPEQGAASALLALESSLTAKIFTLKKEENIPAAYGSDEVRKIIIDALADLRKWHPQQAAT